MPKPAKQIIIDAIIKEIEQGKAKGKILAKFGGKWRIAPRTYDRYWKAATQQHTVKQEAIKKELAKIDEQAAIEARKRDIITAEERKEILSKIATGALKSENSERIKAISELNKMEGDYAPTRVANTNVAGEDIKPLNDSQVEKLINAFKR